MRLWGALVSEPVKGSQANRVLLWQVTATTGMLAGIGPRLAKRSLQTALLWTLYEELWGRYKSSRAQCDAR